MTSSMMPLEVAIKILIDSGHVVSESDDLQPFGLWYVDGAEVTANQVVYLALGVERLHQLMSNPALKRAPKATQRILLNQERVRRRSGDWGPWEEVPLLPGQVGSEGWLAEISTAYRNRVFSVLRREANGAIHLAVSSLSEIRPTWWEMQRIKDEIAGPDATAVEVYPPHDEVVDDANMYHIWVVDKLPFGL